MPDLAQTVAELNDLQRLFENPRSSTALIETGPRHIVVDYLCKGAVRDPNGIIKLADTHRVRFIMNENYPGAVLTVSECQSGVLWHPNVQDKPPFVICADLEHQVSRRGLVPLISTANLVFEIITANEWSSKHGIYNAEAARYYAECQAQGKLPFDPEARLI